jgi:hypothetical protein
LTAVVSHPGRKNKNAARMGHPGFLRGPAKGNRRSFDSLRCASVAQDDTVVGGMRCLGERLYCKYQNNDRNKMQKQGQKRILRFPALL